MEKTRGVEPELPNPGSDRWSRAPRRAGQEAAKAACTQCTQMFQKRVEGHQKSHRRCPFFSLYCIEKEIKSLEQAEGAGAEEALELKRSEHTSGVVATARGGRGRKHFAPAKGELFNPSSEGPVPASSDGMAGASDIGGKSDSRSESQATPESSKGEVPLSRSSSPPAVTRDVPRGGSVARFGGRGDGDEARTVRG